MKVERYVISNPTLVVDINYENVMSPELLLMEFSKRITSSEFKDAFYLPDKNYLGQDSEGITTFGVITNSLLAATIHENNYESCKEIISSLRQMIDRSHEMSKKNNIDNNKII